MMKVTMAAVAAGITTGLLALSGAALAQASGDGRLGPHTFNDAALDQSLAALNLHLQARYANDDMMLALNETPPAADFVAVASAVGDAPELRPVSGSAGFGIPISDGGSLNLHLASFNDEVLSRPDDLFVRVAVAAAEGVTLGFGDVADIRTAAAAPEFATPVFDDPTLDSYTAALHDQMFAFFDREARLSQAVPGVTGNSFDLYSQSLTLY